MKGWRYTRWLYGHISSYRDTPQTERGLDVWKTGMGEGVDCYYKRKELDTCICIYLHTYILEKRRNSMSTICTSVIFFGYSLMKRPYAIFRMRDYLCWFLFTHRKQHPLPTHKLLEESVVQTHKRIQTQLRGCHILDLPYTTPNSIPSNRKQFVISRPINYPCGVAMFG